MTEVKRYLKRPVAVDAVKLNDIEDAYFIRDWIIAHGGRTSLNEIVFKNGGGMLIDTLEGSMIANVGDYVIKGVEDEFYPCKPAIFNKTYQRLSDETF